jgi:oligopeptide/dipeptide ABC transporter ATP-binding protein
MFMSTTAVSVEITGASVQLRTPNGLPFDAVHRVDLQIPAGATLGIVGESGSGKSTLGRAIAGLVPLAEGSILLRDGNTETSPERVHSPGRVVGMIFQDPYSTLNPMMSAGRSVERALVVHRPDLSRAETTREAKDLLARVGLGGEFFDRYPSQLSGGQRQRVAIARALAPGPSVLVADEPTSALDVSIQAQILDLLQRLVEDLGMTMVIITHDFGAVRAVASRVAVMHLGEIVETAPLDEAISHPRHPYTQALLSAIPSPARRTTRLRLAGAPLDITAPPNGCRLHPRCPYATTACATTQQALVRHGEAAVRCMRVADGELATPASDTTREAGSDDRDRSLEVRN